MKIAEFYENIYEGAQTADSSMSAKIILKAVSDFHTDYPNGKPVYCMDFLYENDFSIQIFC